MVRDDASMTDAEDVLRQLWARIDEQDWDGMATLLDPGLRAEYVHTGETFDAAALVRFNREYPGSWRASVEELVATGDKAVSRTRVSGGGRTFYAASFATVQAGRIVHLVEVWTGPVGPPPDYRKRDDLVVKRTAGGCTSGGNRLASGAVVRETPHGPRGQASAGVQISEV